MLHGKACCSAIIAVQAAGHYVVNIDQVECVLPNAPELMFYLSNSELV